MAFQLVDNFERVTTVDQSVNSQPAANGKTWATAGSQTASQEFKVVSLDGGKTRTLWCNPTYSNRAFLPLATPVKVGTTATLFFRIFYTSTDQCFFYAGLTADPQPASGITMASYVTETGPLVSAYMESDKYRVKTGVWYKVWMVINLGDATRSQMKNSFRIYFQDEVTLETIQVKDSHDARQGHTDFNLWSYPEGSALLTFMITAGYSKPFYIDSIYADLADENLADPMNPSQSPMLVLAERGATEYSIVHQNRKTAREAANILAEYVRKAAGATISVNPLSNPPAKDSVGGKTIYVVSTPDYCSPVGVDPAQLTSPPFMTSGKYAIQIQKESIILAGLDGGGEPWNFNPSYTTNTPTLSAVSRFLEEFLNVRWYWPGELTTDNRAFGEIYGDFKQGRLYVPRSVKILTEPTSAIRDIQLPGPATRYSEDIREGIAARNARWLRMNRAGVADQIWHQHYWYELMPKAKYYTGPENNPWEKCPDGSSSSKYFAYYNPNTYNKNPWNTEGRVRGGNEPVKLEDATQLHQLCVSGRKGNPPESPNQEGEGEGEDPYLLTQMLAAVKTKTAGLLAIPIAPNDGEHHCACNPCLARDLVDGVVDFDPYGNRNIGRRMFWFFDKLARKICAEPEYQNKIWVTTYAYGGYTLPPRLKGDNVDNSGFLYDRLIVFDVYNGYGFLYWDSWQPTSGNRTPNRQADFAHTMERWGTATAATGGKPPGKLAVFCNPYFLGPFNPATESIPFSGKKALVDLIARLNFNRYIGGYFEQQYSMGHWPDRYLLARLLSDAARPRSDQNLQSYTNQISDQANQIMDNFYSGLFGNAAAHVKSFFEKIENQIKSLVQTDTATRTMREAMNGWSHGVLFDRVFKPIRSDASTTLNMAASSVRDDPASMAHLNLVQKHWQFTDLTIDFYESLDLYGKFYNSPGAVGTSTQLSALRTLSDLMPKRTVLVEEINQDPNLRCNVMWPNTVELEYDSNLATKSLTLVNMKVVPKVIKTSLTIENNTAGAGWPIGVNPKAPRQAWIGVHLRWTPPGYPIAKEDWPPDLWIDGFGRVDYTDVTKSYIVVLNDLAETTPVTLTIKDVDPSKTTRKLMQYDLEKKAETDGAAIALKYTCGQASQTPLPFSWAAEESPLASDTATFNAPKGITVLVLSNNNFAPWHAGVTVQPYSDEPYSYKTLNNVYLRTFARDDSPWLRDNCGKFLITDDKGEVISFPKPDGTTGSGVMVGYVPKNSANYYENIDSRVWTEEYNSTMNLMQHVPNATATYRVYAMLYDRDGIKRVARGENGDPSFATLSVTAS